MTPARLLPLRDLHKRRIGGGMPTILLACGSFSPVTYLHLRLFEQARDFLREHRPDLDIVAGVFSPVHDDYKKQGLARAQDRLAMTRLAVQSSDWLCVDDWECRASGWSRTAVVLQHIEGEANRDNPNPPVKVMLLAGGDLVHSFNTPNLWDTEDLRRILSHHNLVVIERQGTDLKQVIASSAILSKYQSHIIVVPQHIQNDISSSKVREAFERGWSPKYLIPDHVIEYIREHRIYEPRQNAAP